MFKFFSILCILVVGLQAKESAGRAELLMSHDSVQAGSSFVLGIKLIAPEGWHTYWKNPGESGMSTSVTWVNKESFSASPLMFPAPQIFESYGMTSYGHENEVLLLMNLKIDKNFTGSKLDFSFELDWLACKKLCLPGSVSLSGKIKIGEAIKSKDHQLLMNGINSLPKQVKAKGDFKEGVLQLVFKSKEKIPDQVFFICEDEESEVSGKVKISRNELGVHSFQIKGNPEIQKGILIWTSSNEAHQSLAIDWQQ